MAKTKISEWSTTPASNTDIDGINIAEGCAPSGINDAIRDLMSQVRSWQSGASGDPFNGPMNGTIGATTAYSGAFTTLSASGTTTLSGLTASTALALDASKNVVSVANTGSGSNVLATSPTLVTPALGTPSSATLTNATGLPISTGVSGLGTGVATALGVAVGSAGAPVVNGGALGTPSSGTVTNLTGTASININGTVGATTPTTGAFTTTTVSTSETLSYGTANGVTYLNGSKVLTSGSALTFDGTNFATTGAGTFSGLLSRIHAQGTDAYITNTTTGKANTVMGFNDSGSTTAQGIPTGYSYYGTLQSYPIGFTSGGYLTNSISSTAHVWNTTGSEQMRLTSTGLGIGTSSPAQKLDVVGFTNITNASTALSGTAKGTLRLYDSTSMASGVGAGLAFLGQATTGSGAYTTAGSIQAYKVNGTSGNDAFGLQFTTRSNGSGCATVMNLDDLGNLGLGVTPTSGWVSNFKAFQVGTGGTFYGDYNNTTSYFGNNAYFNGTNWKYVSSSYALYAYQDRSAGKHVWAVAASGTAGNNITWTEAMTLDASGNLLVGTTSASAGNTFGTGVLARSTSKPLAAVCDASSGSASVGIGRTNSTGNYVEFYYGTALTSSTGTISTNGTTTAYNTTSDQRLKENIADADSASSLIDSLQVRKFDWKADGSHQRYGFVAQELVTVAPEAVHQPEDEEQMMAVDYSKLVPMLVKEIQSLRQRLSAANL